MRALHPSLKFLLMRGCCPSDYTFDRVRSRVGKHKNGKGSKAVMGMYEEQVLRGQEVWIQKVSGLTSGSHSMRTYR